MSEVKSSCAHVHFISVPQYDSIMIMHSSMVALDFSLWSNCLNAVIYLWFFFRVFVWVFFFCEFYEHSILLRNYYFIYIFMFLDTILCIYKINTQVNISVKELNGKKYLGKNLFFLSFFFLLFLSFDKTKYLFQLFFNAVTFMYVISWTLFCNLHYYNTGCLPYHISFLCTIRWFYTSLTSTADPKQQGFQINLQILPSMDWKLLLQWCNIP